MILTLANYKTLTGIGNEADEQISLMLELLNDYALNYIAQTETDLTTSNKSAIKFVLFQMANNTLSSIRQGVGSYIDSDDNQISTGSPINSTIKSYSFEGNSVQYLTQVDKAKISEMTAKNFSDSLTLLDKFRKIDWGSWT